MVSVQRPECFQWKAAPAFLQYYFVTGIVVGSVKGKTAICLPNAYMLPENRLGAL